MNAKAIRQAAGWSRAKVAVMAGCSEPTARLFEVAPDAVSDRPRKALERVYRDLEAAQAQSGGTAA